MSILSVTEKVRARAKSFGRYDYVAKESGVGYQWLTKFSVGSIKNPTVANVAKLERFFAEIESSPADMPIELQVNSNPSPTNHESV
jgi:hypothetical protein